MSKIENNLYLGDFGSVKQCKLLDIDLVITIMEFKPTLPDDIEHIYFFALDEDDFDISKYFNEFIKIIEENSGKKIFVHCYSGASRSATLVASYLVHTFIKNKKLKKSSVEYVLKYMKKKRSVVDPNDGFIKQLEDFRTNLLKIT